MTTLEDVETPFLTVDRSVVLANSARLRARLDGVGVGLRQHVKTAKSIEVARLLHDGTAGPITVSTLAEAEAFADAGYVDILYAVGIAPHKLARVATLRQRGVDLVVLLDSVEQAAALAADQTGLPGIPALIEIDCDGHRSGVKPDAEELITIGRLLHEGGATLLGVMTHAGSSYDCDSVAAIVAMAEQERSLAVHGAERLRAAGLPAPVVSVGSSPTATYARDLTGVTEVRAGVFVFFDLVMAGIEVCKQDDIALSVLTTVIGHQKDRGWIITDAGWMAMSRDRGTAKQGIDQGYGVVCDVRGTPIDGLIMEQANQEHGVIAHRSGNPALTPALPVGTLLRILPNHACATGAQHDRYHVVQGRCNPPADQEICGIWSRFSGW